MASKRRLRRRSCKSKVRHIDQTAAVAHARHLGFQHRAYKCKFCGGWHVGRPNKKIKQSAEARRNREI
jgi:hypothetical protein